MPRTATSDITQRLVGDAIREARRAQDLTQAELAERLDVHPSYIGGLETGRRNVTVGQLAHLSAALGARLVVRFEPVEDEPLILER